MNEFTVDFPLILLCLVFGSGLLWLLDSLFLAPSRKRRASALQAQYPRWSVGGSSDAERYQSELAEKAAEPTIVEYARSFFSSSTGGVRIALLYCRALSNTVFFDGAYVGGG
jgi:signal peptidase I